MKAVQYRMELKIPVSELKKWKVLGVNKTLLDQEVNALARDFKIHVLKNWREDLENEEVHIEV
jgi:hypothetical protein